MSSNNYKESDNAHNLDLLAFLYYHMLQMLREVCYLEKVTIKTSL
jgi:hypothetical protein